MIRLFIIGIAFGAMLAFLLWVASIIITVIGVMVAAVVAI